MTTVNEIQNTLTQQIAANSGLDQHREYLGISKISGCPRAAYNEYFDGVGEISEATHRFCFAGYEQERSVLSLLQKSGIGCMDNGYGVIAPFDDRLCGHIDGLTLDNDLLEIKSLTVDKFERIRKEMKASYKHFIQVQLYMRYGGWRQCFTVYRCRETYEHLVIPVMYNERQAEKAENKAKAILAAIDAKVPPACECGRCK